MRNLVVAPVVALSLLALPGCKTDKKDTPTTKTGSGSGSAAATGSDGSAAAKPGEGSGDEAKPANLTLPKGDGTPPKKTDKPFDKAKFEELAKLDAPTFEKAVRNTAGPFDVRFTTPRPKLSATVTIAPCFDCTPMDLDKWKAKEEALKVMIPDELRKRPDTQWELGKIDLNGETAIYTFQFGYFFGKDDIGNPFGGFTNAYALYWNDGKNQIRVVAEYKDDPVSKEDLQTLAPREDLEKIAKAFLDFYTHSW